MPPGDLTDPEYWSTRQKDWQRQHGLPSAVDGQRRLRVPDIFSHLAVHLSSVRGGRMLELGCVPGEVSAALALEFGLRPEGLDFSPEAEMYLETMRAAGIPSAVLHRGDLRSFDPPDRYDLVASFGLIEHFADFAEIMDHHDRLLRPGGLCLISVPHFRWAQWGYHFLFDRPDLRRHNLKSMRVKVFRDFAARHDHQILELGHIGRLGFFNVNLSGPPFVVWPRRIASRLARESAARLGRLLPANNPLLAPFIVYLGRKPEVAEP
jgi:SAM-dependent methyltransferase